MKTSSIWFATNLWITSRLQIPTNQTFPRRTYLLKSANVKVVTTTACRQSTCWPTWAQTKIFTTSSNQNNSNCSPRWTSFSGQLSATSVFGTSLNNSLTLSKRQMLRITGPSVRFLSDKMGSTCSGRWMKRESMSPYSPLKQPTILFRRRLVTSVWPLSLSSYLSMCVSSAALSFRGSKRKMNSLKR